MTNLSTALVPALKSMEGLPPSGRLVKTVNLDADDNGVAEVAANDLVPALTTDDPNDPARVRFQLLISRWDGADGVGWTGGTPVNSIERRAVIYDRLGFDGGVRQTLDRSFPRDPGAVIIESAAGDWRPWYSPERQSTRSFYWDAYSGVLERNPGWSANALARLDSATTAVVSRLADPSWTDRFQSKGLVVGYVQSGKTANFTGVLAKAIDAGYRLIIVLTGTVELLRRQTQRRLDMELIGVENILGGIDENDPKQLVTTDYYTDQDWHSGKFLRHHVAINTVDAIPAIKRLTKFHSDYKSLRQLDPLDFRAGHELVDKRKALYDPVNLFSSDARVLVVKKNVAALRKFAEDLGKIHARLGEIPALIIDDEADQASVNTKKQKNPTREQRDRTAINRHISDLLVRLPRAQYVGYTATPFANVFIDPDDSEDIFPKDFIVSLDRPVGYMGGRDFHDLDGRLDGETPSPLNSNEKAFVRDLYGNDNANLRRGELQRALDSFVLTGALKLFRREPTGQRFRHHTMLVHESVKVAEHAALAEEIRELWRTSGYNTQAGIERLRDLYDHDFAVTTAALQERAARGSDGNGDGGAKESFPLPGSFDELMSGGWLGAALDLIDRGTSPVIVVNGSANKDYEQDDLDFQANDVWKILVGGAKLSRGFTVEGLTVTYYTRRTQQADTLMQMGRWFGFRRGYRDLVRLFIGRNVPAPGGKHIDLYEAFGAVVQDEEDFREELRRYAAVNETTGEPQIRPEDVPPMVFQQLPWLKPTASNKMYNAELVRKGEGGKLADFSMQAPREDGFNATHFEAVRPLLEEITDHGTFDYIDTDDSTKSYSARYGIVGASVVRGVVAAFHWARTGWFAPYLEFVDEIIGARKLTDFVVLVPELVGTVSRPIGGWPGPLPILKRARRPDRPGFSGSSFRQRAALQTISGKRSDDPSATRGEIDTTGGHLAADLHTATRGAMLLTFALDSGDSSAKPKDLPDGSPVDPADIATLFSWSLPYEAAPGGRIGFKTRKSGGAIVDND